MNLIVQENHLDNKENKDLLEFIVSAKTGKGFYSESMPVRVKALSPDLAFQTYLNHTFKEAQMAFTYKVIETRMVKTESIDKLIVNDIVEEETARITFLAITFTVDIKPEDQNGYIYQPLKDIVKITLEQKIVG